MENTQRNLSEQEIIRRQKLAALQEAGADPFQITKYDVTHHGADIKEKHAQKAADLFAEMCPNADVNLLNGGQPVYYYLISAE